MNKTPKKFDLQSLFLGIAAAAALVSIVVFMLSGSDSANAAPRKEHTLKTIKFDGESAHRILTTICEIGPRISNTDGMKKQQELLSKHFTEIGAKVEMQQFQAKDPRDGSPVPMSNLIARWHPERKVRILLCAHYDTRPFADRDPIPSNRKLPFLSANDGTSGVAILAVMGKHFDKLKNVGVDVVLFDGEEFVFNDRDPYFLGSTFFAQEYVKQNDYKYRWGILLDMVGDANLQLPQEVHGLKWPDSRPLVKSIWRTARKLGVKEFINRPGMEIKDDHLPLHDIARIPCCDIIDFEYPRRGNISYWHTIADTPDKCSALSLAKVGWVVHEWLKIEDAVAGKKPKPGKKQAAGN